MRSYIIAMAALFLPLSAHATDEAMGRFPAHPIVVSEAVRTAGEWHVAIAMHQDAIGTTVDAGRVMSNGDGGGALGALIIESKYNNRPRIEADLKDKAEAAATPIRSALVDFDANGAGLAAARAGFAATPGFKTEAVSLATTAADDAGQFPHATLILRYEFSADFTQIRVVGNLLLDQTQQGTARPTAYMPMISIVQLRNRGFDIGENARLWARDNAAPAKAALSLAFAGIERLLPRALTLTQADLRAFTSKSTTKAFAGGFNGAVVDRTPAGGIVLWQNALVAVETLP